MRFFSIVTAVLVSASLYLLVFEREALLAFAAGEAADVGEPAAETVEDTVNRVSVVAMASRARMIEQVVLVRGRTEAARQVEVRAETSGSVVSEPLRKGHVVKVDDLLCSIDPGTRQISLADATARLAEAKSRLPEAEARLAEAMAAVPAAEARLIEARARVPEAKARVGEATAAVPTAEARLAEAIASIPTAEARLAEALAGIPTAEARLAEALAGISTSEARLAEARANVPAAQGRLEEARAKLPEAEARVAEANARLNEADINLNAATKLAVGGFASDTRVAGAEAARQSALAGVQAAMSQFEGAKAGVQSAMSQLEGALAGVQAAIGQVESAKASVQSAKGLVESAKAAVQSAKGQVESAKASVQSAKGLVESAKAGIETAHSGVESAAAGVISAESQIEGAKAGVQSARSGVESAIAGIQSAEAAVAGADNEIERLDIHAPFSGLLESDTAELGALLQPGSLCATIIQLDPIKLVGFIAEIDVDKVTVGSRAGARLATGREVIGQVTFLSRSADPTTRTFRVEVEVPNADQSIRDGQTAEIIIESDGLDAHLVPQSSLTLDDEGALGVRVVNDDQTAGFVPIQVLRDTVDGMYVSGLPPEANIIVVGQEFVTAGVPVKATYKEVSE